MKYPPAGTRAYQIRSIKLVDELYRLLIRNKVPHEYPIPTNAMIPVKAASETELRDGAITTKQTKRTELKWIMVGVTNAPITSLKPFVNSPLRLTLQQRLDRPA